MGVDQKYLTSQEVKIYLREKGEKEKMNKTELISKVAERLGVTKKDTGAAVDAIVDVIIDTVAEGDEVSISGFGKFVSVEVAERTGIIQMGDRKGESYVSPAHKSPKFKPASAFKTAVR